MKTRLDKIVTLESRPFLSMYDLHYTNKLGQKKFWTSASRKGEEVYKKRLLEHEKTPDAVLIAAYHEELNKLVIVRQFRVPINDCIYEIPAGLIDDGEQIETCVKRELREETGLKLEKTIKVQKNLFVSPGMTDECGDLVIVTCSGEVSYEYLEPDEEIEILLCSSDEVREIISKNENVDLKTLFVMNMFLHAKKEFWKI